MVYMEKYFPEPKCHLVFKSNFFIFSHFNHISLLRSLRRSSEVERNPKTNISFFNDLGGHFSHFCQFSLLGSLGQSLEVERDPKTNISFFNDLGAFLHFGQCLSLRSLSQSSEVESNPKMNISFFDGSGDLFLTFWSMFIIHITGSDHCDLKTRNSDFQISI